MIDESTVKAISDELAIAYMGAHRTVPESNLLIIAQSIADAVPGLTAQNAHEVFRRAKQSEAIPTVPVLVTALRNHHAESYGTDSTPSIGYGTDGRERWLPKEEEKRQINLDQAVINYCAAMGGNMYSDLCKVSVTVKEEGRRRYLYPEQRKKFLRPIWDYLKYLYGRYWRYLPQNEGYPKDAPIDIRLTPPHVYQFKDILFAEGQTA